MSRLIDADALKANMFDYAPPEMLWDRRDIQHKIDEMPTVKAIPFEYIERVYGKMTLHDQELLYETVCEYIKENGESNRLMEE